jgi:CRP/FNR family transcriptional regulator
MSPQTIDVFLCQHPVFGALEPAALSRVAGLVAPLNLARGEMLALEGEPCRAVYLVMEGRLLSVKTSSEGREQIVSQLPAGEIVYAVPAWTAPLAGTTQAATRATLLRLERINSWPPRPYPLLARRLLAVFAARLRRFGTLAGDLALRSVAQRLARLLVEVIGPAPGGGTASGPRLTQREMAARLGTVREVVARNLAQFEAEGWIALRRGVIEILDIEALRALAEL